MLHKAVGNMYDWISSTWNPIKGKCVRHDCIYCYMKRFPQKPVRLDEKTLKEDLGKNNIIFVGSSCDVFAKDIPDNWISRVLEHCAAYPENQYIFQSKDPSRIYQFRNALPKNSFIGTTIETNRDYNLSKAPGVQDRAYFMGQLDSIAHGFKKFVTLEPICDFDVNELLLLIRMCKPDWVNIGADSKNHHLPEPSRAKVNDLIVELKKFTEVRKKTNLERLS